MAFDETMTEALGILAGHDFPCAVVFRIPDSKNLGYFRVEKNLIQEGRFFFEVHAAREGSMYTTHRKILNANEQAMRDALKEWLASQAERDKLRVELEELSESVDDKEGEFPSDY